MESKILEKLKYAELWLRYAETSHDQVFKENCRLEAYRTLLEVKSELGFTEEDKEEHHGTEE